MTGTTDGADSADAAKVFAYLDAIRRLLVIIMLVMVLQLCGAIIYFFAAIGER